MEIELTLMLIETKSLSISQLWCSGYCSLGYELIDRISCEAHM